MTCGVSVLTVCGLYCYLNRMFLTVVHKGNSLIELLDAIDRHARLAVVGPHLHDSDMVGRVPVSVVQREFLPIRGKARSKS